MKVKGFVPRMKVTRLFIENFRSLKHVNWFPGDLNVVIGPNGSGKSNLLQVLELIGASTSGSLRKYIAEAGSIDALVWDGRVYYMGFSVWASGPELRPAYNMCYGVRLAKMIDAPRYLFDTEVLRDEDSPTQIRFQFLRRQNGISLRFDGREWPVEDIIVDDEDLALPAIAQMTIAKEAPDGKLIQIHTPARAFNQKLAQWSVYRDMDVSQASSIRRTFVPRYEKQVEPDGQNFINVLNTLYTNDPNFEKSIDFAMRAAFGDDFDRLNFATVSDARIEFRVRWKTLNRETSASELSDGTLRFLLLLAILATPDPPPLIAIDEPETGLHPSMLPIIAEYAVDAAQRTQVIMTTHSDQFLDAFGDTKPTTTVAKWENGETTLTVLGEDELAYWLKDYSLGKLFRTGELEALA